MEKERTIDGEALEIWSKGSEITVAHLWKAAIIYRMNADCDMKLTEKQTANLKAWKRWGAMMKMLKAIHREIEPQKKLLRESLN